MTNVTTACRCLNGVASRALEGTFSCDASPTTIHRRLFQSNRCASSSTMSLSDNAHGGRRARACAATEVLQGARCGRKRADPPRRRPHGSVFFRSREAVKGAPEGAPPKAGQSPLTASRLRNFSLPCGRRRLPPKREERSRPHRDPLPQAGEGVARRRRKMAPKPLRSPGITNYELR